MSRKVWKFSNTGDGPLEVPGFYLTLIRQVQYRSDFPYPFVQRPRLLQREIAILEAINKVTDRSNWHVDAFNEELVAKWGREAMNDELLDETAWKWCVAELRDKARVYEEKKYVLVLDAISSICKSDDLVPETIRGRLKTATEPLRNEPDRRGCPANDAVVKDPERFAERETSPDYYLNINHQVRDLVNPSRWPFIYGTTQVLSDGDATSLDNMFGSDATETAPPGRWSEYIWLPCEAEFDGNLAADVHITSYINDLHPRHKTLYKLIEKIISLAIEPWNELSEFAQVARNPPRVKALQLYDPPFPDWARDYGEIQEKKLEDPERYEQALKKVAEYLKLPNRDSYEPWYEHFLKQAYELESPEFVDCYGIAATVMEKWKRMRNPVHPNAGDAYSYEQWKPSEREWKGREHYGVKLREQFREYGIHVVVKMTDVDISPDKPCYMGEEWHMAGLPDEYIVATSVYCYDIENVTEPRISFLIDAELLKEEMCAAEHEEYEERDDWEKIAQLFGFEEGLPPWGKDTQTLGSVAMRENRLLTFPNTLWHKMESFKLVDTAKPGHCRFLTLYLVDPGLCRYSTRNVPPQQHSWWAAEGYDKIDFSKLPPEILKMITDEVGEWPIGSEEAKQWATKLVMERAQEYQDLYQSLLPFEHGRRLYEYDMS
ncbi:hypothetical protein BJ166DRAFT_544557 [Pestalotiopsis sp. NC0098]|nr:hypothetical protein BJ166DRAFT_544557 [Pestalotiopsis sp. NC0098]